jgi:hypothetical protein
MNEARKKLGKYALDPWFACKRKWIYSSDLKGLSNFCERIESMMNVTVGNGNTVYGKRDGVSMLLWESVGADNFPKESLSRNEEELEGEKTPKRRPLIYKTWSERWKHLSRSKWASCAIMQYDIVLIGLWKVQLSVHVVIVALMWIWHWFVEWLLCETASQTQGLIDESIKRMSASLSWWQTTGEM